ncbi:hypothetical protein BD309DRAFT_30500 [Dichomitus squalens]|nr:hypothetical protein BD309DRAFT_30500 [Dichomitus squalens]
MGCPVPLSEDQQASWQTKQESDPVSAEDKTCMMTSGGATRSESSGGETLAYFRWAPTIDRLRSAQISFSSRKWCQVSDIVSRRTSATGDPDSRCDDSLSVVLRVSGRVTDYPRLCCSTPDVNNSVRAVERLDSTRLETQRRPYLEARSTIAAHASRGAFLLRPHRSVLHTSARTRRPRIGPSRLNDHPIRHRRLPEPSYSASSAARHSSNSMVAHARNHGRAPCFYAPEDARGGRYHTSGTGHPPRRRLDGEQ